MSDCSNFYVFLLFNSLESLEENSNGRKKTTCGSSQSFSGASKSFVTQETKPAVPSSVTDTEAKRTVEAERGFYATLRKPAKRKPSKLQSVGLIPVTIRMRPEIVGALKRTSLERQLNGEETFTQQEIVERALESWHTAEGYI